MTAGTTLIVGFAAVVLALTPAFAGPGPGQMAQSKPLPIGEILNSDTFSPGDVIGKGIPGGTACLAPPQAYFLPVRSNSTFVHLRTHTTQDCDVVVAETCGAVDVCSELVLERYASMEIPTKLASVAARPMPSLGAGTLDQTIDPSKYDCDGEYKITGNVFTMGYGEELDILTAVGHKATYLYGCGPDSVVSYTFHDGPCSYAAWNGWQVNDCYTQEPNRNERAIGGEFECHNNNFCRDEPYLHHLWHDFVVAPPFPHDPGCLIQTWGTLPPYMDHSCWKEGGTQRNPPGAEEPDMGSILS